MNDFKNKQVQDLPPHLSQYVVAQDYENYTALDHAVWRYVMRQNFDYLKKVAHGAYIIGLEKTGIGIENIPDLQEMNNILGNIGWGAVCVDGFIPPAAFMEFQAYNVLVIAADIRQINHIEYTPAPDIIHEAAGHAPIISDPDYSEYLRLFGEIGSKAVSSKKDYELFEAIRHLSIVKEDPYSDPEVIKKAEAKILDIDSDMGVPSEMSRIRNLHWWTVEYGLIGSLNDPKIYGAGLLSSIGESVECLKDKVKKLPYDISAADVPFDITEMQPQLFVTPNFRHLREVLEEFANTMALRTGGLEGIHKVIESENIATCKYNSGIQVSGVFTEVIEKNGIPIYIKTTGPSALAFFNREIIGHGKNYHADGFGSPVGKLNNVEQPLETMTLSQLKANGIIQGKAATLEFESGIKVKGHVFNIRRDTYGHPILISFSNCTVIYNDHILFQPEWGMYDMAIGSEIDSVFSGPADIPSYKLPAYLPKETTHKINYNLSQQRLQELYRQVRELRVAKDKSYILKEVFSELKLNFPKDWLLTMEMLEIVKGRDGLDLLEIELLKRLDDLKNEYSSFKKLIEDGLTLINS
jgi:phenylalanine-4-hydroxylase